MKKAEEFIDISKLSFKSKTLQIGIIEEWVKQAQVEVIKETVKRCYDEFELFEVDGIAVGIDYNSSVNVGIQLRKEIE